MSTHTYYHIGVYVECRNPRMDVHKQEAGCVTEKCPRYHVETKGSLYCSICGKALDFYDVTEKEPTINVWDLTDAIDQALMPSIEGHYDHDNEIDIWLPNFSEPDTGFEPDENTVIELADNIRAEHLSNFAGHYAAAIAILLKTYGEGNVKVKWGVVADTR
jgi:hypothetical protein